MGRFVWAFGGTRVVARVGGRLFESTSVIAAGEGDVKKSNGFSGGWQYLDGGMRALGECGLGLGGCRTSRSAMSVDSCVP